MADGQYLARVVATLVFRLVDKGILTLAEGMEVAEITDADMVSKGRPDHLTLEQAIDRLAEAHRISEERGRG